MDSLVLRHPIICTEFNVRSFHSVGLMAFHMIKDDVLKIFLYISLKIRKINALWGGVNIPPPPPPRHSYQLTHAALHQTICYVKCQPIKLNCPPGTPPSRHSPTKHNTFSPVYPSVLDNIIF